MTHPSHEDQEYFKKELAPVIGKKLIDVQVSDDGYPVLIFEGDSEEHDIYRIWILSDAEGNSGGWPEFEAF